MARGIETLLSIASPPLGRRLTSIPTLVADQAGRLGEALATLLLERNGFFAFESALHVFPFGGVQVGNDLLQWNSQDLWRYAYPESAGNHLFFAEDVFGEQFSIAEQIVWRFNPETGEASAFATSMDDWADRIMEDSDAETGYPLAHQWQELFGPLRLGCRLIPKLPFVAGGEFDVQNLYEADAVRGMLVRGSIAQQIRELPDGTSIQLEVIDG